MAKDKQLLKVVVILKDKKGNLSSQEFDPLQTDVNYTPTEKYDEYKIEWRVPKPFELIKYDKRFKKPESIIKNLVDKYT